MSDVLAGVVVLATVTGWIILLGFLHAERRERRLTAKANMLWAREDERAKIRAKAFASPLSFWSRDEVLALLDGERDGD